MAAVLAEVQAKVPGVQVELAQLMEDLIGDLTAVPQPIEIKLYASDTVCADPAGRERSPPRSARSTASWR